MRIPRSALYPLFAAAYPVLALAAANRSEIPGLWVIARPLGISLAISLLVWLLLSLFIRDRDKRGFLTLMAIVLFASYGYFIILVEQTESVSRYAHTVQPFLFILTYLTGSAYLLFRLVPDLSRVTHFLTIFTAVLVTWATLSLLRQTTQWTGFTPESNTSVPGETSVAATSSGGPDIYLVVLDKYTGSRSLRNNFDFDNTDFETFLAQRGFILPHRAQANYIFTPLALAALLNYRYLDYLLAEPSTEGRTKIVNNLVEDSAVLRFLRQRNYRFIFFPTAFQVTESNRFADLQVPNPRQISTEFEIVWRRTTLAQPLVSWLCQQIHCPTALTPFTTELPKLLEWKFQQLSQVPKWPRDGRPLFVFAHITIPHEPYVFKADCNIRPPFWPSYYVVRDENPEKQAYIAQLMCLNRRLRNIVDHILHDSPKPPVILLQADHGHGRLPLHIPDVDAVTPDRLAERADIFAAYYLPGADSRIAYDSISPVNVFRTVLHQYFQADLGLLPDKTYWSPSTNMFKFTRVDRGHRWSTSALDSAHSSSEGTH